MTELSAVLVDAKGTTAYLQMPLCRGGTLEHPTVAACSSLPDELAARTPVEVCFRYLENGRLTVYVAIEGIEKRVKHELLRENSLSQEALDSWRKYISGLSPMVSREGR